jgi:hypothetical protein
VVIQIRAELSSFDHRKHRPRGRGDHPPWCGADAEPFKKRVLRLDRKSSNLRDHDRRTAASTNLAPAVSLTAPANGSTLLRRRRFLSRREPATATAQ